jgi:hypothetical protein
MAGFAVIGAIRINTPQLAPQGAEQGVAPGVVVITASGTVNGQAFSATAPESITNAAVTHTQITPAAPSLAVGSGGPYHR